MSTAVEQFKDDAKRITLDLRHRGLIQTGLRKYEVVRDQKKAAFHSWESARQSASEVKHEAVNNLDKHLVSLVEKLEARGTKVHWATTASQARDIMLGIIRDRNAKSVIKSKAMTSE